MGLVKRYQKYSNYWHLHIVTLIRLYPSNLGNSLKAMEAKKAIDKVFNKTAKLPDGENRVYAIKELYNCEYPTIDEVAMKMHYSKRTIQYWAHNFVYDVAKELKYIK